MSTKDLAMNKYILCFYPSDCHLRISGLEFDSSQTCGFVSVRVQQKNKVNERHFITAIFPGNVTADRDYISPVLGKIRNGNRGTCLLCIQAGSSYEVYNTLKQPTLSVISCLLPLYL